MNIVAILSSTILTNGVFSCTEVNLGDPQVQETIQGTWHYVGHPDTRALMEELGAVKADSNIFEGLAIGESYLAVPLANNKRDQGWTVHKAVTDLGQLKGKLITRIA